MSLVHFDVIVRGRVQGVWYRKYAVQTAKGLGLRGYAANQADGTVRIEVEGQTAQVEEFLAWCSIGPPLAEVTAVERTSGEIKGYANFEVRR